MNPAFSVIVFTVLFATGLLLSVLVCLRALLAQTVEPIYFATNFSLLLVASLLIVSGLIASLFHLGHPMRAWRAITQWRNSWLSREAVASIITLMLLLLNLSLTGHHMLHPSPHDAFADLIQVLTILFACITLWCTSRIYTSLKTIPAWQSRFTAPVFFGLGLWSAILILFAMPTPYVGFHSGLAFAILMVLACGLAALKWFHWQDMDARTQILERYDATGMGTLGKVKAFGAPHTEANFLMREMGYVLARKHGLKLRRIAMVLLFAIPVLTLILGFFVAPIRPLCGWLAVMFALIGGFVERWLFFADAKHVVMNYYR